MLRRFQNEKVDDEDEFQIIRVRRKHIWKDTLRAITKDNFRCNVRLKVHFIGEEAEDEGGPLREFLCLAIGELCEHSGVLQGPDCRKTFSNNPLLLERGAYYCAGILSGISLQQGGLVLTAFQTLCTITFLTDRLHPPQTLMMLRTTTLK